MLCITVALELWHLCWSFISNTSTDSQHHSNIFKNNDIFERESFSTISGSAVQLFFGIAIAASVIYALWRENAVFLLPYLLLQVMIKMNIFKLIS